MSDLQKERREFEEWVKEPGHPEGGYRLDKTASGAYINPETRCAWRGWLGRAQSSAAAPDLHGAIMNIECRIPAELIGEFSSKAHAAAYKQGHRDARHAAADLAITMRK